MYLAVKDICDADSSAWQSLRTFAGAYADLKIRVGNIQCQSQDDSDIAKQTSRANGYVQSCVAHRQSHSYLRG